MGGTVTSHLHARATGGTAVVDATCMLRRRAALHVAVVAAIVAAVLLAPSAAAAAATPSLAALRKQEQRRTFQVADLHRQLAWVDMNYDRADRERVAAVEQLSAHLVARYKAGDPAAMELLLAADDVETAMQRATLARQLRTWRTKVYGEHDAAAQRAWRQRERGERLAGQLVAQQAALDQVRVQIQQRLARRAQRAAATAARARARRELRDRRRARAAAPQITSVLAAWSPAEGPAGAGLAPVAGAAGQGPSARSLTPPPGMLPLSAVSAQSLDAYLYSKGSPMAGQGTWLMLSGQRWGVDPRLVVAIAGAESQFGEITCAPHNAWGWACPDSPTVFASWAEGIEQINEGLRRYYLDEGYTTVARIQGKYAPSGAGNDPDGLNNHWTGNVTRFLVEQGGNPSLLGPQAAPAAAAAGHGGAFG